MPWEIDPEKYFIGKPCRLGHSGLRRKIGKACYECSKIKQTENGRKEYMRLYHSIPDVQAHYDTPEYVMYFKVKAMNTKCRWLGIGGEVTKEDIQVVYNLQEGKCEYCSSELNGKYDIDHMLPLARGGKNETSNLCISCCLCNGRKSTMSHEQYLQKLLSMKE